MGKRVSNKDVSSSRAYNNRKLEQRQGPSTGNTGSRSRGSRHRRGPGERSGAGTASAPPRGETQRAQWAGVRASGVRGTRTCVHTRILTRKPLNRCLRPSTDGEVMSAFCSSLHNDAKMCYFYSCKVRKI